MMTSLAGSDLGMASLVLEETERTGPPSIGTEALPTGTAYELGGQIHQAMKDWGRGFGALTPVICPATNDGRICTLGIFIGPRMITTSWYRGTEQMAPVVDIPAHVNLFEYNPDWSGTGLTAVRSTRTWPWSLTKEMLVRSLSYELKSRRLALQSVDAVREFAHEFASAVTPRGFESRTQANIGDAVRYIDERTTTLASLGIGGFDFSSEDIRLIRRHLVQLSADGEPSSFQIPGLGQTLQVHGSVGAGRGTMTLVKSGCLSAQKPFTAARYAFTKTLSIVGLAPFQMAFV